MRIIWKMFYELVVMYSQFLDLPYSNSTIGNFLKLIGISFWISIDADKNQITELLMHKWFGSTIELITQWGKSEFIGKHYKENEKLLFCTFVVHEGSYIQLFCLPIRKFAIFNSIHTYRFNLFLTTDVQS